MRSRWRALKQRIRHVPDFPEARNSVLRRDDAAEGPRGLPHGGRRDGGAARARTIDLVVGIESRGFIFGSAIADRLKAGSRRCASSASCRRRRGARRTRSSTGPTRSRFTRTPCQQGQRVLIVDDLLATGGTAAATVGLVRGLGADIVGVQFLIELAGARRARRSSRASRSARCWHTDDNSQMATNTLQIERAHRTARVHCELLVVIC